MSYDLVVIGSGPGGYEGAIRASQNGLKVAIVEREALGGICLNWGCIPAKALLKSAEVYDKLHHLEDYGLSASNPGYDFEKVIQRSRGVTKTMSGGVAYLMKKNKIDVIEGSAVLEPGKDAPKVVVTLKAGGTQTVEAKNVMLAVGARAREIPAIGAVSDGERIWTYRNALAPKSQPKSLIIIGSGAIGIEFASFYKALGTEVTVVEAMDRILPVEDHEVSVEALKAFKKRGINFRVGAKVTKIEKPAKGVAVHVEVAGKSEILTAEGCIVAVGIVANTDGIGLEKLGVVMDRGHVKNDGHGKTNVKGLYAIGDCAGPPWLAHKASHEAVHAADYMAGRKLSNLNPPIPGCTYATPEVASVGITEQAAKEQKLDVKIGRFPFRANGRAVASSETLGFVKVIFDKTTGALLGAHMIGANVTEMVQGFCLAITMEATEEDLQGTVFPHPTMSEAILEASLDADGRVINT
ncbi:dihydrolipoyl dehydrogenase [Asticcacaulis sp. ZE23SCel15]|uniref:dihydrolipoyl dehydrogenase n=1 Tax=Asticcacaulis sp. ZE23SCel15 TaxID=3059027 RepID=UPI00265E6FC2|nr:dihydrolipoyl dehydrogenase [Asticcacaulis sp. ZE23SCel15]WKL56657.1 dihydrolipoyl dehydrogenase [Asticcacaulis sp. ZE23SCel15]